MSETGASVFVRVLDLCTARNAATFFFCCYRRIGKGIRGVVIGWKVGVYTERRTDVQARSGDATGDNDNRATGAARAHTSVFFQ
jgi:hypothetical protein